MAHELAGALQQMSRIRQGCALKEPHVHVRIEYIDVAEGRISQTCNRTAVMQELPDFVPAFSHHLKPPMRYGSQFTGMLFHPGIDGGIPLDSAVESQQFRSHHRSTFRFRDLWLHSTLTRGTKGIGPPCPEGYGLRPNRRETGHDLGLPDHIRIVRDPLAMAESRLSPTFR